MRYLNHDESAFDVDQLESVGKKKKSLSRERSRQTKRLERHLMVHTSRCHMLASQCFSNGRLPPTQASYPGVQLSSLILTILRTLGRGGPTGAPRKKFQTRTFLVLRPRVNFHFQKWRREKERERQTDLPVAYLREVVCIFGSLKVALKRNSSVIIYSESVSIKEAIEKIVKKNYPHREINISIISIYQFYLIKYFIHEMSNSNK